MTPSNGSNGSNGSVDLFKALPVWAKIVLFSPMAAISMYLVYIGANQLPEIRLQQATMIGKMDLTNQLLTDIRKELESQISIRSYCVSIADSDAERSGCLSR